MPQLPNPEYVIALAERLRNARNLLAKLEEEWAALFLGSHPDERDSSSEDDSSAGGTSLSARIVELLRSQPTNAFTAEEVAAKLEAKNSSISSILSRLVKDGAIEKRSSSEYGAKQTTSPELRRLQELTSSNLSKYGHETAGVVLGNATFNKENDEVLIQTSLRKTMLALTFNNEAGKILRAVMRALDRSESLVLLTSSGERVPVP